MSSESNGPGTNGGEPTSSVQPAADQSPADPRVWILASPDGIPEAWRGRAVPLMLVPLMPEEAGQILREGSAFPAMSAEEEQLAQLLARGMSVEELAKRMHLTTRSAYRRVAQLRRKVGARNSAELASRLSERGF